MHFIITHLYQYSREQKNIDISSQKISVVDIDVKKKMYIDISFFTSKVFVID